MLSQIVDSIISTHIYQLNGSWNEINQKMFGDCIVKFIHIFEDAYFFNNVLICIFIISIHVESCELK